MTLSNLGDVAKGHGFDVAEIPASSKWRAESPESDEERSHRLGQSSAEAAHRRTLELTRFRALGGGGAVLFVACLAVVVCNKQLQLPETTVSWAQNIISALVSFLVGTQVNKAKAKE